MSQMYRYYQREGGVEEWTPIQANQSLDGIRPTFVTILTLDTLLDEHPSREVLDAVKYQGPMYFDLDDADDVYNSIEGARILVGKLMEAGLQATDMEIYLSGKKGLHIIVPAACFMEKDVPQPRLPAIYKEVAFKFATDTIDFRVYTGRKGRMLRTCFNVRENGNYRVPITVAELDVLDPATYASMCKVPRHVSAATPAFRPKFALVYDAARQKAAGQKRRKPKPTSPAVLKEHAPTLTQIMQGRNLKDVGFNKIAIQLAIYAREAGLTEDALIEACEGLIQNHDSDGHRYNSPRKREFELRRMHSYVDDNAAYEYAIEPIRALIKRDVSAQEGPNGEQYEDYGDEEAVFSNGVKMGASCYLAVKGDQGEAPISNFVFTDVTRLIDPKDGNITGLVAYMRGDSSLQFGSQAVLFPSTFTGSTSLHNAVSIYGGTFTGTDIHARGLYQIMLRNVSENVYLIDSEGLNFVNLPRHENPDLRKHFTVWADSDGVRAPKWVEDLGVKFIFQGYPDPKGALQSDLLCAPSLASWVEESPDDRRPLLREYLLAYFNCQQKTVTGKAIGWAVACFWRQLFHAIQSKFPLMHIYGQAGAGKTEFTETLLRMFYYNVRPKSTTPQNSTNFAFLNMVGGSGSIPVLLDEYKPGVMNREVLEKYRALFRDAYNMKESTRGGGNRQKDNFNAMSTTVLSGPIVFLAEAVETETALVERMVLVSYKKPSPFSTVSTYDNFMFFKEHANILSMIGHTLAGLVATKYTPESLAGEFDPIYKQAQEEQLLRPGDQERMMNKEMSISEFNRRGGNRQRIVYNNAVAAFGLRKLAIVVKHALGNLWDEELAEAFRGASKGIWETADVVSRNAIPEYVKILTAFSDMTRLEQDSQFKLLEGKDYNLSAVGGKSTLVLAPRAVYNKYRAYQRNIGQTPLYGNDMSFSEGLYDCPQFMGKGSGLAGSKVDTVILDLDELYRAGVIPFSGKSVTLVSN
jgi:hypothetical protein